MYFLYSLMGGWGVLFGGVIGIVVGRVVIIGVGVVG